jgi:hypothetical protein
MFSFGSHHPRKTTVHGRQYGHHHGHHGHSQEKQGFSKVRAVHNVAKGPNVNVVLDGKIALENVGYMAVSDYLKVPSGRHTVAITTTDGSKTLASATVTLSPGSDYTVIAHGDVTDLSTLSLLALQDDNSCPKMGKAHVRFIHAAATVPDVDVWANMENKVFSNVSYGQTGKPVYLPVAAGEISIAVTPAGSGDVVLGPIDLRLDSGKTYTIVASGLLEDDDAPISAIISQDNACATVHGGF